MVRRRSDGEGSIYETGDGRWRGSVVVRWIPDGKDGQKPVRRYVSGKSRRDVAGKIRTLLDDRDAGQALWSGVPTVHEWLTHWLEQIAKPAVRPSTWQGYEVAVRRWKGALPPRLKLDKLTPEHLEAVYAAMRVEGHRPANVRLHHRVMSRALVVAVKRGRVRSNVAELVDLPTVGRYEAGRLTPEQAVAFLDAAAGPHAVRWLFAVLMGWRQGEVLGLTWDRIDLDAGTVARKLALARVRGAGLQLVPLKSKAGDITLPLPPVVVTGLRALKAHQATTRAALGQSWVGATLPVEGSAPRPVDLVFSRTAGQAISREDDWAEWHRLLKVAGCPAIRLHDARHSAASFMAAAGVHPRVVMELLGHSTIAIGQNLYTEVASEDARAALVTMEEFLERRRRGPNGITPGSTTEGNEGQRGKPGSTSAGA